MYITTVHRAGQLWRENVLLKDVDSHSIQDHSCIGIHFIHVCFSVYVYRKAASRNNGERLKTSEQYSAVWCCVQNFLLL